MQIWVLGYLQEVQFLAATTLGARGHPPGSPCRDDGEEVQAMQRTRTSEGSPKVELEAKQGASSFGY